MLAALKRAQVPIATWPLPSGSEPLNDVPEGYVRLILVLEIPLNEVHRLCLRPQKYLVFLAWCILGVEGGLAEDPSSATLDPDGQLNDGGLYYYVTNGGTYIGHAVDLAVIKDRSGVPSETTNTRDDFRNKPLDRDAYCVFTGTSIVTGDGMHIIPYKRGFEWFRNIVENRSNSDENVATPNDINDIRNGVFAVGLIYRWFDLRGAVILMTPNRYLTTADVPPRANRPSTQPEGVAYPPRVRYTLQWLEQPEVITLLISNNVDAAFIPNTRKPKPSALLLHYNYGAAAVKRWGHGAEVLESYTNPARPAVPISAQMGAPRTVHDRSVAIGKCDAAQRENEAGPANVPAGD